MTLDRAETLVKSKQRVVDHGEVFTPAWLVEDMLGLVGQECDRIDARVLEPACGSGNFLVPVLLRKLTTVERKHGHSEFEKRHYALFSLMCIYGIELLADNAQECRDNLAAVFMHYLDVGPDDIWSKAARRVLALNVVRGDGLAMTVPGRRPLGFPEWAYLGRGKFQRRDFRYDNLTQRSSYEGTLFGQMDERDIFTPTRTFPIMTVQGVAGGVVA